MVLGLLHIILGVNVYSCWILCDETDLSYINESHQYTYYARSREHNMYLQYIIYCLMPDHAAVYNQAN
jgi:hypothetical protein